MKSRMSKSFVMISTVPEFWNKKYRFEPLIIAAEHTFLDYSHTLPADSKKTWFDSSGPPYLVFGFSAHWEEVWEKDWYLVQCRRYCLRCACYKKAADLSFIVVYGFCLYNMFYIHCSSHDGSVWGLVDVDFFYSNSSLICVHFKSLVHLGVPTFVTDHLLLCFHLLSQLIISFQIS